LNGAGFVLRCLYSYHSILVYLIILHVADSSYSCATLLSLVSVHHSVTHFIGCRHSLHITTSLCGSSTYSLVLSTHIIRHEELLLLVVLRHLLHGLVILSHTHIWWNPLRYMLLLHSLLRLLVLVMCLINHIMIVNCSNSSSYIGWLVVLALLRVLDHKGVLADGSIVVLSHDGCGQSLI
jgi:hypothetical protein